MRYWRAAQIAERIGTPESTIWRWAQQGKISKPVKLSKRVTVWDAEKVTAEIAALAEQ